MRESVKICRQALERISPTGAYAIDDPRITPPPKDRVYTEMEALIQHFLVYSQGFTVPAGEAYVPVEGPRGEHGFYVVVRRHQPAVAGQVARAVAARLPGAREDDRRRADRGRHRRDRLDRRRHGRRGPVSFHPKMSVRRGVPQVGADARRAGPAVRVHAGEPRALRSDRAALSVGSAPVGGAAGAVPGPAPAGVRHRQRDALRRRTARHHRRRRRGRRVVLHDVLHEAGRPVRAERLPDAVVRGERRRARHRGDLRGAEHQAGRDRSDAAPSRCSRSSASAPAIGRRWCWSTTPGRSASSRRTCRSCSTICGRAARRR